MTFSVWNYGRKSYDYYDDGRPNATTHAGAPPISGTFGDAIGDPPEACAWRLPIGARKVGSGDLPQGRIATAGGLSAMGDAGVARVGVIAVAAYLAWRFLR